MTRPRILIADDQPDVIEALRLLLKSEGFDLQAAASPAQALDRVKEGRFDAALVDLNYTRDTTSGKEGLDLLAGLLELDPALPVVVMTAWGSVEGAVEAMRRGARDYIEKPWDNDRVLDTLRAQVQLGHALRRSQVSDPELVAEDLPELIATDPSMKPVLQIMRRIAPSDANVLIMGEHGTGKDVAARWLHAASKRKDAPFVPVNMGGFSEGVFESELFGHVKGAFTDAKSDRVGFFEMADGGTLFLDEIANTSMAVQAKLLRVLESGELQRVGSSEIHSVDVRVVSATNAKLDEAVRDGVFREDLLYRLNTVEIRIPPLRERPLDILPLAEHFLAREVKRYQRPGLSFSDDAKAALRAHPWPGNVRELEHAVERSVLMAEEARIGRGDLGLRPSSPGSLPLEELKLDEVERKLIERALDRHDGNVSRAAETLGLSRSALYRRLERHDIGDGG